MIEKIYNLKETSEILGLSTQTIRRFIKRGTLPAAKIGREYKFKESDINALIEASRIEPKEKQG